MNKKTLFIIAFSLLLLLVPATLAAKDYISFGGVFSYNMIMAQPVVPDASNSGYGTDADNTRVKETLGNAGYGGTLMGVGMQVSYYNNNPIGFYYKFALIIPISGTVSTDIPFGEGFSSSSMLFDSIFGVHYLAKMSESVDLYWGGGIHTQVLNLVTQGDAESVGATVGVAPYIEKVEEITFLTLGAALNFQFTWTVAPSFRMGATVDVCADFVNFTEELKNHFSIGISAMPSFFFSFVL